MAATIFLSFPIGPLVAAHCSTTAGGFGFLDNVPVVAAALIAVAFLMPESRSAQRPGIDVAGVLISSAGLAGLTYGPSGPARTAGTTRARSRRSGRCRRARRVRRVGHLLTGARPRPPPARARRCGPAADRARALPVRPVHLARHPGHAGVVRDVRHHVRDATVLPGVRRGRCLRRLRLRMLPMMGEVYWQAIVGRTRLQSPAP